MTRQALPPLDTPAPAPSEHGPADGTPHGPAFAAAVARVRDGADPAAEAASLHDRMTAAEHLELLHGQVPFWPGRSGIMEHGYNHVPYVMGAVPRLGVPGVRFVDGPRGVVVGQATAFPVPIARGATWDPALEQRVGDAIGREVRAAGGDLFGGVCVNLPRQPGWGRTQETYSDQPVVLGAMGAALVRGVSPHAVACVKHLALNSLENSRFDVDVRCGTATLHEDYLPHFQEAVQAGADAVMCAYNSVNGRWASQNGELLTDVLRGLWGFEGLVVSDFVWAIRDAAASLAAGTDLEAPFAQLRAERLPADLAEGRALPSQVRTAGLRVLAVQLRHHARRTPDPAPHVTACPEHVALARTVATRAMVLLRNEPVAGVQVLPLGSPASVAVLGRLADRAVTGDAGSSDVEAPEVVTPVQGLRAAMPGCTVDHHDGSDLQRAVDLARSAEVAVVVVGNTADEEGEWVNGRVYVRDDLMALYPEPRTAAERTVRSTMLHRARAAAGRAERGGDRTDLGLRADDVALVRAVAAANPRTVVVLVGAGALVTSDWDQEVPGLVLMWYAGMQGGAALADLLLGTADFGGRLPFAVPADAADLPAVDPRATTVTYDRWYGQRLLARLGREAAYPLGYGLSYGTTTTGRVEVSPGAPGPDGHLEVGVEVCAGPERATRTVVQVYGTRLDGDRAGERELLGFAPVELAAGATTTVTVQARLRPLSRWCEEHDRFWCPPGAVRLEVARHWGDPGATAVVTHL